MPFVFFFTFFIKKKNKMNLIFKNDLRFKITFIKKNYYLILRKIRMLAASMIVVCT